VWARRCPAGAEHGVGAVKVTNVVEIAGVIAAQVVSIRCHRDAAIRKIVRDNGVLYGHHGIDAGTAVVDILVVVADGTAVDRHYTNVVNATAEGSTAIRTIATNGSVVDRQRGTIAC
jgi:hypothetical protein